MTRYKGKCPKCGVIILVKPKVVTWDDFWDTFRRLMRQTFRD